ncbi:MULTISPECIES: pilin [unclassified Xanthomonas]|uniref:pilin n=1 Tax=unclassified Xanthomonas TaxID=2643310 RepID=UPI001371B8C5|nr:MULTISPECIES: pilin [unclassified Xanthomonas]MBB6367824.1 type IV pilus assembly protein PilA [Xanthomonas sp. F10]MXV33881.1 pilin [Xanthomonas sp. LMG 8989]UYC13243.1 pilin [Xanthomonas sp. CFBP 8445]
MGASLFLELSGEAYIFWCANEGGHVRGFALIELMVAVAIVAILAAIGFPVYQGYVARSQTTAALAILRPGKTMIETAIAEQRDASLLDADYIGVKAAASCSAVSVDVTSNYVVQLGCRVSGNSKVEGKILYLKRNVEGVWTCDASAFEVPYRPGGCG